MIKSVATIVAAASFGLLSTTAVMADGPAPAVVMTPIAPPPAMDWTGPYAGLLVSANNGSYGNETNFPGDGEGDLTGNGYGAVVGYNLQSGNTIYGGEVTYSSLNVEGAEECVNPSFECGAEVDGLATVRARVGMAAGPSAMFYATAGWASADATVYTDGPIGDNGETKRINGMVYGVGFERAISNRFSVRGAILRHDFQEDDYDTDVPYTDVDIDFTSIELGGILRF